MKRERELTYRNFELFEVRRVSDQTKKYKYLISIFKTHLVKFYSLEMNVSNRKPSRVISYAQILKTKVINM